MDWMSRTGRYSRLLLIPALAAIVMLAGMPSVLALHYDVDEEGNGSWSCHSESHAYVKADSGQVEKQHKKVWAPGIPAVEEDEWSNSGGVSYTYGTDEMDENVDYYISGDTLSLVNSWPGCISD